MTSIQCRGITCDEYPEPEVVEDDVPLVKPQLSHAVELSRRTIANHSVILLDLLNNYTTGALREIKAEFSRLNFHELGDIDCNCCKQGRDDVGQGPVVLALDLAVVVRAADSQVTLKPNTDDQINTGADTHPGNTIVSNPTGR